MDSFSFSSSRRGLGRLAATSARCDRTGEVCSRLLAGSASRTYLGRLRICAEYDISYKRGRKITRMDHACAESGVGGSLIVILVGVLSLLAVQCAGNG